MSQSDSLYGIADLGTWTIRFSINSIQPRHARILPCVFQDKAPIRLYKNSETPISRTEIDETVMCLDRFISICRDYGVPSKNIRVAANPQEAPNFDELVYAIETRLDLMVLRLSNEGEHWANAYAIASSFHSARGLYVELRPQHANIYYLNLTPGEGAETLFGPIKVKYSSNSSFRLHNIGGAHSIGEIRDAQPVDLPPVPDQFNLDLQGACSALLEKSREANIESSRLFLSGSGFYGLHSLLANATPGSNKATTGLEIRRSVLLNLPQSTPVARILREVAKAIPSCVSTILYARHNLRTGLLFQSLPREIRAQDPILVATQPYALPGASELAAQLQRGLPDALSPSLIRDRLVKALANSAYIHSSYNSEVQASSALVVARTGVLAGAYGLTQGERVLVGLALCERWGGALDENMSRIRQLMIESVVDTRLAWWAVYTGLVLHMLGAAYPGAHVRQDVLGLSTEQMEKGFMLVVKLNEASIYGANVILKQRIERVRQQIRHMLGPSKFGDASLPVEFIVEYYRA